MMYTGPRITSPLPQSLSTPTTTSNYTIIAIAKTLAIIYLVV